MRFVLLLLMLMVPAAVQAAPVWSLYGGANGVWYDDEQKPGDFEIGGSGSVSLQPIISLVGEGFYGFAHSYLRGAGGVRVTATDPDNKNFSIGIGIMYHASSEPNLRAEEWAPDATIGWVPWPVDLPKLSFIARGSYGLTSNQAHGLVGGRVFFGGSK